MTVFRSFFKLAAIIVLLTTLPTKILAYWQKYPQNPIFTGGPGNTWDKLSTLNPSIIKYDSIYRLVYEGNNGSGWRIGEATSNNGIDNWIKNTQPSISIGSLDGWENETSNPTVISTSSGILQMWYTSVNTSHWSVGSDRFRMRYATKIGESQWEKHPNWAMTGTPGSWDEGGIARGLSVVYKDGIYHLWYSATNTNDLTLNPFWRIGYATSSSGIDWLKMNNGNPVITPNTPWENNNVSYPHVKYENGSYKMWYSTGNGDVPNKIVVATSNDGIVWNKTQSLNPVIDGSVGQFDSNNVSASSIIYENNIYKLYYSGYDGQSWRIGLATASADILDPPNTPTPENTPTPVNTPVPTPTPTPLPVASKIIFLPGMGGSWNYDALINCKLNNYSGNWVLNPIASIIYAPILQTLDSTALTVLPFYYDWRQPVPINAALLEQFINTNVNENERTHLLGHSLGGLIIRNYLENTLPNAKIDHVLTAGTPHQGSPISYPAWAGGVFDTKSKLINTIATIHTTICKLPSESSRQAVQRLIPSLQNTLPTFDYLKNRPTNTWINVLTQLMQNSYLPTNFQPPFINLIFGTLAGENQLTTDSYLVRPPNNQDQNSGNWLDGKPVRKLKTKSGDDTVTTLSAHILGATNLTLPYTHAGLMTQPLSQQTILNFFNLSTSLPLKLTSVVEPTSAIILISPDSELTITSGKQKSTVAPGEPLTLINPIKSISNIVLTPRKAATQLHVFQFFPEKTLYKKYNYQGLSERYLKLHIDPNVPSIDALR